MKEEFYDVDIYVEKDNITFSIASIKNILAVSEEHACSIADTLHNEVSLYGTKLLLIHKHKVRKAINPPFKTEKK